MIKGLPEKLKDLRAKYGLSQREVAKKLDISASIVSGYETGERTPSVENILAMAALYHCSTDYLLGRESRDLSAILNVEGLTNRQIQLLSELVESIRRKDGG